MLFIEKHYTCFILENENKNEVIGWYISQGEGKSRKDVQPKYTESIRKHNLKKTPVRYLFNQLNFCTVHCLFTF